ncbi:MAG TPA: hypothetical protein VMS40_01190 [Vicinamibacterales bacterium]|nr:hypothetical protein [Vicinamibacterales bacterium]
MTRAARSLVCLSLTCGCVLVASVASAHDGPPYPIVSNQLLGRYRISVWTDPDTTDDGSAGGQFWVMIDPARADDAVGLDVQAVVTIRPLDREGAPLMARAAPVNQDSSRQFATLVMDHEGRFAVHVDVESASGRVSVDSDVQATYDLRPSRFMLVIYLLPFLLAGVLWTTLLVRRRRALARARHR